MTVWPEERLREHLEGTGRPLELEGLELLREFGARRPTDLARADIEAALAEAGVGIEPSGWGNGGDARVKLYLLDDSAAEPPPPGPRAPVSPPEPAAPEPATSAEPEPQSPSAATEPDSPEDTHEETLRTLYEGREAPMVAYCGRVCAPARVVEAVEAAFGAVAQHVIEEGGIEEEQLDRVLLEKLRGAAARRAPTVRPHGDRKGTHRGTSICEQMPMVLAARASGFLTSREQKAMDDQLDSCPGCRALAARFAEAEAAYSVLCDAEPLACARGRLLGAESEQVSSRGRGRRPGARWEAAWIENGMSGDRPRVVMRRTSGAPARPHAPPSFGREASASSQGASSTEGELGAWAEILAWLRRPGVRRAGTVAGLVAAGFAVASLAAGLLLDDEGSRDRRAAPSPSVSRGKLARAAAAHNRAARTGDPIGRLWVPRLRVSRVLAQGAASTVVQTALGHDPKTALPGGTGTVGFLAHRMAYAAPLRWVGRLRRGDRVVLTLPYGRFTYAVNVLGVVRPGVTIDLGRSQTGKLILGAGDPPVRAAERVLVTARLVDSSG